MLTLWENFIDHVGINVAEQLHQYPIILARKIAKSKSYAGSLQLIPFEDEIISIVDAHQHLPGQIVFIQVEFSLLDENQQFYILACSTCKQIFTRLHSRRRFYCATCRRSANLIPRCQFDITITDNSGSATTLITDQPAETMLHLTSEEIYDIHCTKSFAKTIDGTPAKLIILSYAEKENIISAPSSPAPMDTGSNKRKTEKHKEEATSHRRHAPEPKTPPPKHYNK
ncbi:hypothetical protein H5410_039824 [Solanum commersonii]|uniref:Replication factor A C-terminal domain-containing protein n=1 Tax=Solanum commersonii TaxID=4109 RepID=A0A9J5XQR7_SOLCO|nr:hypothetical protein H5410_039824 [Solanum commersonii]